METLDTLLLAEFYTASGYLDRLLFGFIEIEKLYQTPKGKIQIQNIYFKISNFFKIQIKDLDLNMYEDKFEFSEFKNQLKQFNLFIEAIQKLPLKSMKTQKLTIEYINIIYKCSFDLHNYLDMNSGLDIQVPRSSLANEELKTDQLYPLFILNEEKLRDVANAQSVMKSTVSFLEQKREEKYDSFVQKGQVCLSNKNFAEAKNNFFKARNFKDSAEILTLIAWAYSLLNDLEQAKAYSMMAIEKDTQYGPAYNDYGNYLLNEGKVSESLRWFELAKRAQNYQNREYPYINAGRAYVLLKQYEAALKEFSLALTLAPNHLELHETVAKLKNNLDRDQHPPRV